MKTRTFRASELALIARAPTHEPLAIGYRVRLNSGGPIGLVVDLDEAAATIGWELNGQIEEHRLQRVCVSRCN